MEGQSEAYNQTWLNSEKLKIFQTFLQQNPKVGNHFNRENDLNIGESDQEVSEKASSMLEMSRKNLSQALFNYWIYEELTDRKEIHQTFFGPYYQNETDSVVTFQETVERFLENVENKRIKEIYQHDDCTPECKKRGYGTVLSADGLWKLSYPICMCNVRGGLTEDLQSYIPMISTNSPLSGQAFCKEHCQKVSSLGYPTDLKDFLKSCSSERQIVNPREYSKPMRQRVDEVIHEISEKIEGTVANVKTASEAQGFSYLLRDTAFRRQQNFILAGDNTNECNKDTGSVMKVRRWSRGILAIVRGGGHIEYFAPLFNSESPTQVAMIFVAFLCDVRPELWNQMYMSYDNMCNVDRLNFFTSKTSLGGRSCQSMA